MGSINEKIMGGLNMVKSHEEDLEYEQECLINECDNCHHKTPGCEERRCWE